MLDLGPELTAHPQEGTVSLRSSLLELRRLLDQRLARVGAHLAVQDEEHPLLCAAEDLTTSGWLQSFPHLALAATSLDPDSVAGGVLVPAAPSMILAPAACTAVYPAHRDEDLDVPLYIRVCAQAFRAEASFTPLRRQRQFTMRELVCIGSAGEVDTFLEELRAEVTELMSQLGLHAEWQIASDPFYRPDAPAALLQRIVPLKREAVLAGDDLAIASVNLHVEHFGEAFAITRGGVPAHSGCVAFGVERWVWAWCAAHGSDPERWPLELLGGGSCTSQ